VHYAGFDDRAIITARRSVIYFARALGSYERHAHNWSRVEHFDRLPYASEPGAWRCHKG
jgi:hypothetical protein